MNARALVIDVRTGRVVRWAERPVPVVVVEK